MKYKLKQEKKYLNMTIKFPIHALLLNQEEFIKEFLEKKLFFPIMNTDAQSQALRQNHV